MTVSNSSLSLRTHSFVFFAVHETRRIFLSPFISKASREDVFPKVVNSFRTNISRFNECPIKNPHLSECTPVVSPALIRLIPTPVRDYYNGVGRSGLFSGHFYRQYVTLVNVSCDYSAIERANRLLCTLDGHYLLPRQVHA